MSNWLLAPLLQNLPGTVYQDAYADLQRLLLKRLWLKAQAGGRAQGGVHSGAAGGGDLAASPFDEVIQEAARRHGVDPDLVRAVIKVESNFDPQAVSHAGAKGLMQLMDATAASLGVENSFDAAQNIEGGVAYLAQQLQRFHGDVRLALAAYNAGPGAVQQYAGPPPFAETQMYIRRVLSYYQAGDAGHDYSV